MGHTRKLCLNWMLTGEVFPIPGHGFRQVCLARQPRLVNVRFSDDGIVREVEHLPRRVVK